MSRAAGITEQQLLDIHRHRESDAFTPLEKLVLDYAEAASRTPVEVPQELFDALAAELDDAQIVELTMNIAWENYRARFNIPLGVQAQGFSEGAYCVLPERHPQPGAPG